MNRPLILHSSQPASRLFDFTGIAYFQPETCCTRVCLRPKFEQWEGPWTVAGFGEGYASPKRFSVIGRIYGGKGDQLFPSSLGVKISGSQAIAAAGRR